MKTFQCKRTLALWLALVLQQGPFCVQFACFSVHVFLPQSKNLLHGGIGDFESPLGVAVSVSLLQTGVMFSVSLAFAQQYLD